MHESAKLFPVVVSSLMIWGKEVSSEHHQWNQMIRNKIRSKSETLKMWMRLNFKCVRIKYLWGKKKQQKSINGKKEHENVDVLEQWTMADGIFFGFDNRRSDNELESTVLGHRKKKKPQNFSHLVKFFKIYTTWPILHTQLMTVINKNWREVLF